MWWYNAGRTLRGEVLGKWSETFFGRLQCSYSCRVCNGSHCPGPVVELIVSLSPSFLPMHLPQGLAFHPEKIVYEWTTEVTIPHSRVAVDAAYAMSQVCHSGQFEFILGISHLGTDLPSWYQSFTLWYG